MYNIIEQIAHALSVKSSQVQSAVNLLDEGATVPFIARYRKEITGGLDDIQLRELSEKLLYLRELVDRKQTILKSIEEQGKLTDTLKQAIETADTKSRLEDLYLPYKPKRRTKGQIAIEAGLLPLAESILENTDLTPDVEAAQYLNNDAGIATVKDALDGAKFILMEKFAEQADLIDRLKKTYWKQGELVVTVVEGKESEGQKFQDYFSYQENIQKIPSHRALAILRGRNEGILQYKLKHIDETDAEIAEEMIAIQFNLPLEGRAASQYLKEVVRWTWRVKLQSYIENDLVAQVRDAAEAEAINVFGRNLKDLLLAAPAGAHVTMGLDPGFRTGVKVAVVDATGKVLDHTAIYPHQPQNDWQGALATLASLCIKHKVTLISIGNGTASRETDQLASELVKGLAAKGQHMTKLVVSEAGASVYSASELAAKEFPDLDVTIRGAISIARRLQDPLAELVKIEPKAIGVGQYQHDVNQTQLARQLEGVVEDCVNSVGVEINTASASLLAHVAGLNQTIANNIVSWRDENGGFTKRTELKKVARLGPKAFEQAAGFLRIRDSKNPLDQSGVHPESYDIVKNIAEKHTKKIGQIIGDSDFLRKLTPADFVTDQAGLPTVTDIIKELEKPGRDPRPEFKTATFKDGIEKISDLKPNMLLEGVITNVTNFGAFVDVGVHQDGLVHISALADKFVSDPHEVVKAGDIVKVKVMEVDVQRKRIGLSMRLGDDAQVKQASKSADSARKDGRKTSRNTPSSQPAAGNNMAALFANAKIKKNGRL